MITSKFFKYLSFLSGMFFIVGLAACGDDSSGTSSGEENGSIESVEDLPACSDSLSGKFVGIGESTYVCVDNSWQVVDGFAKGICNIEECTKSIEGLYTYVEKSEKVYQCKSGVWRDVKGNGFSEEEFMGCYVESIVKKSASSLKDLDECTDAAKDDIFSVAGELYVCANQKYSPLKVVTISERYMPKCTVDSAYTYVLSKMKSAVCSKGLWYIDGEPVKDPVPASSSSVTAKSSSSSKKATSSSSVATTDDPTPVRGICLASVKSAEKGTEVEWNFVNMGGTPVTYDWKFSEEGLISSEKSPKVVFAKPGIKGATLVVNKGLESESEEIECIAMEVSGTLVTGCECSLDESFSHKVSTEYPGIAKWTVSGCSGASPFTYAWNVGENITSKTATLSVTSSGQIAPEATITNSDGESMTVTCPAITAKARITASCYISGGDFSLYTFENWTYDDQGFSLIMNFSGTDGTSKNVTTYYYGSFHQELPDQAASGVYKYSLIYDGDTVCSAVTASCSPESSTINKGDAVSWKLNAPEGYTAKSYSWSFGGVGSGTSNAESPEVTYANAGMASATLTLDKGSNTEVSLACRPLTVRGSEIKDCSCGVPELLSESNDVAVGEVEYKWTISGCTSEDAEPLTYLWDDETTELTTTRTYSAKGLYTPVVKVTNTDGEEISVKCEAGKVVENGEDPVTEITFESGLVLEAGLYSMGNCSGFSTNSTIVIEGSSTNCTNWLDKIKSYSSYVSSDRCYGSITVTEFPLLIDVPDGETLTLNSCW